MRGAAIKTILSLLLACRFVLFAPAEPQISTLLRRTLSPQQESQQAEEPQLHRLHFKDFISAVIVTAIEKFAYLENIPRLDQMHVESLFDHFKVFGQKISTHPNSRQLISHIWYNLGWGSPDNSTVSAILSEIDSILKEQYIFFNFYRDTSGIFVEYIHNTEPLISSSIDPADIEAERFLLEYQREYPFDSEGYLELKYFYENMVEKYSDRYYYFWQLSWVLSCLGEEQKRTIFFREGLDRDFGPVPDHTPIFPLALALKNNRFDRTSLPMEWGSFPSEPLDAELNTRNDHAVKYMLQFLDVFAPRGIPLSEISTKEYEHGLIMYGTRAKEILRSLGIEIYAFFRDDFLRFMALVPETGEVVGFRMQETAIAGRFEIAIDTFYRINPEMVKIVQNHDNLTLLIHGDGSTTDFFDALPDQERARRLLEARTEHNYFGLTSAMFEQAYASIEAGIIPHDSRIGVIMIAGTSSAGKTPGSELILARLAQADIHFAPHQTAGISVSREGRRVVRLSMDDYFISRHLVPEIDGVKDYDNPAALDINRFIDDLRAILRGELVELPSYEFKSGLSNPRSGYAIQLNPGDILLIEGIHALNPLLTGNIGATHPQLGIFVDCSDILRLPRRMVRDDVSRGLSPYATLVQWDMVTLGEERYILPTREYADVTVDTNRTVDGVNIDRVFTEALFDSYGAYMETNGTEEEKKSFQRLNLAFRESIFTAYSESVTAGNYVKTIETLNHITYYYGLNGLVLLSERLANDLVLAITEATVQSIHKQMGMLSEFMEQHFGISGVLR